MSFLDNIKDLYYGLEDGYYHFLDNIQDHIPVYKVVDPIDKVFPSFALLLIIVLIIGFLIFTNLIAIPATVTLTASFSDDVGNPIPQLPVQLVTGTQTIDKATDVTGNISFEVPSNSNVQVLVSLDGFGEIDETILIGEGDVHETFVLTALQLPKIKNIQFVDASNFPIHQKITLSVSCAQPGIEVAQDTVETDSDGKITLAEPVGCGALTVTVLGPSEFQSNSYVLQHPSNIFQLQAIDIPPPPPPNVLPLRVRIESEQGTLLTDLFFEVSLYKGEVFQLKKTTMNGTVRFDDLEPGVYRVTVQDPEGAYAGPGVENIVVNSNSPQNPIAITLTEQLQIQISVLIVEATTNQPISGATIVIRDAETIQELNRQAMGDDGEAVSFSWVQNIDLKIEAMAERYVSKSIETSQNSGMIIIELDEITPANSATVRVQVVDAVGDVVPNAQVFLRYEDSQAIAPYPPQISDLNGTVEFTGVQESELFAYAEKYPAAGSSASQEIVVGEKYELEVLLAIGSMELTINAWNENNELIPDSTAEIWDAENNFLGSYPLGNGSTIIPIKADKRIYVVVKNSEYFAYQTETFQLYKDNPITIDAILPSRLLGGGPKAVFMGVFDQQNNPVQSMQAGGTYYMRMQLRIPEGTNYTNAGIHFRVGASNTIENDNIRIIRVNVGNASLLKGSTFNAPLGQVIDLDPSNLTTGDAKWAEFSWLNPKPQAYNAVIEVHVKKETIMNTPIPFYYRAWSIQPTGGVLRDPVDEELGNGFETSSKHGLYANAHAVVSYFEGQDAECINNFCFSNLRVFDQTEGLYLLNTFGLPYETRINQPYQLSFILTNNSVANYENALLSIRALFDSKQDNQLKFTGYSITNASQHTIESTNPPNSEIVNIDVGEFKTNTGVSGWIDFDPTALNPTSIEIQLVYNGEIVVTKIIDFETLSDQEMKIDFQPAIVPAFTPTLTNAHITLNDPESEDHEMDLEDVLVTLTIEATDHSKTKQQQTTNSIGFVEFDLSSLAPNTKLKIEAEKPNYFAEPFKTHVDGNVLEFDPEELESNLKTSVKTEELLSINVINKIGLDLTISDIQLVGNFTAALDQTRINNYLQQLIGHTFRADDDEVIGILQTALNQSYPIFQHERFEASLYFTVYNQEITEHLPFVIPVTITVGLTGLPEETECLVVDETEFSGTTQDNRLSHTFTLTNQCKVEGKPIVLHNLQAQLEWEGAIIGNIDLSLREGSNTNNMNSVTLLPGDVSILFEQSITGSTYYGQLDFTPKAGHLGDTAEFTVTFLGESATDTGLQKVTSNPINATILIANLENCLVYNSSNSGGSNSNENSNYDWENNPLIETQSKEEKPIIANLQGAYSGDSDEVFVKVPYGGEGTLTMDSTACGDIELDVVLCKNDHGCTGGTEFGSINLSTDRFSLTPTKPTKTIRVTGTDIAGIYGIPVEVRTEGRDYRKVGLVDVIVDPNPEFYFTLDKYEFFLKGISSKDTATLANDHFGTTTIVDAPASNWANMNDPDEDDAFGNMMPLMAAGLLPAMIPPLIDALGNARDNGQKAGKKAMDEFNDGKEAAENAEKKAKDLADECKPGKGACENMKALQDALKKLKPKMEELTKQSMTQSISSLGSACGFSGGNLEFTAIKGLITNGIEIGGEACGSMTSAMGELKSEFNTALNNFGSLSDSVCSGGTGSTAPAVMQKTRYAFLQASPLPSYLNLFNNLPATVRGPNADNGTNTLPIPVTIIPGTTPITPPPGTIPPGSIDPTAWIQAHDPKGNGTFTDTGSEWRLEIVQGNQMLRLVSWDYGQTTSIVPVWQYQDEWVSASELDAILNAGNHLVLQDNVSRAYSNGILAVPVEDTWAVGELPLGTAPHHTRESVYDAIASSDGKIIIRHSYFDWWDLLHWFPQTEWFSPETNWASGTPFVRSTDYIVSLHNFGQLVQGNFQEILNSTEKNYWLANQTNAPAFFQSQTSALSSFNAACKEFNTAHEKTQKAVSDYSQAKKLGRFTSAGDVSKAGKKAGDAVKTNVISDLGQTTSAITSGNGSITEATGKMNELKTNFDSIAKKRDCLKQTTDEIGKYVKSQKARTTSPLTSQEKACIAAFKSFEGSFNETLDPVDDLIKTGADSVDQTREKVLENLETTIPNLSENANTAATDATQQSNEAANEMNDLSDATKNVSKDNTGTNSAALGNMLAQATQLGLMAAMMDGMFNADDTDDFKPGEEPRVQNQTQVFNIDLRKDNQGIELDKEGIIGYYDPENHKVFGDMEKQTIGVVFENVGIEESEPYYSTATFKAVEHLYGPVTTIPFSTPFNLFGSGWGLEFFGQTSNYSQQFHLKYVTGDLIEPLPPIDSATFSCTQGAMVGRTGEGALPRVKLSWKWNDIPLNLCDASNENYVYCDSTQFAIVVLKRLRALDDFLKANGGLPCPTNPFEVLLTEDTAPLSEYLGESPFDARSLVEGCWLPESTELFDGYPSLLYYVSEAGDSVQWTEEIKNIQDLQDLLLFDAYIMQDGFSEDFLQDFSQYYNHISFSDAPAYFHQDPQGSYNQFFDNGLIEFKQKFVNSNQLPTSGLYQADLLVEFGDGWKLFDSSGDPAGTVTVELLAVRQTPFNSPFYYLPFNGLVGLEGSRLNRQGYGVGFDVLEQDAFRISRQSDIDTLASTSSNPVHFVSVSQERALENLNSRASQRGFILDITNVTTNQKNMLFTPALATPVLMKVNRVQTSEEFSAYYMLRESDIPATTGNTLTFWTGSGACRDFSGDIIASVFDEKPDRKTNEGDLVNGWEFAYAIDWEKAVKGGDVYLRTVFYTPAEKSYSLFSLSDNATLRTADQGEGESIELRGISDMAFNRKGTTDTDRITALDDLFTLVEQGAVCVTNTGVRTSFWWNPKTILEKEGSTDQSIAAIEQGLEAGSSCIG